MNPTIDLGFISIHYYSLFIFLGIIIGGQLVIKEAKKFGFTEDFIVNLLFGAILIGIIGARLYFVLFNFDYYIANPLEIFAVWNGGLAIHGGIIFALIFIIVYLKTKNINILLVLDCIVVGLIIGQAIGRWGNFFNGEAHGPATTLAHLQDMHLPEFIINGMNIGGTYYIPTFFFESLWCLIGFIVLLIFRRLRKNKIGMLTSIYLVWYGIGRFFIEGLRTDSLMLFNLKAAQFVSLFMIISGIILFIICLKKSKNYKEAMGNGL